MIGWFSVINKTKIIDYYQAIDSIEVLSLNTINLSLYLL